MLLLFWFDHFLDSSAGICKKIFVGFLENLWHPKEILKLTDLYRGDGCPYALSSIGLVKILCDVFNVDKDPKLQLDKTPVYKFILTDPDKFFQVSI